MSFEISQLVNEPGLNMDRLREYELS